MRVIGGVARGLTLRGPAGMDARPTSELVRSAIFSILEPMGVEGARVLDLYAGSGALGIEALSRGAAWCDFVESNLRQCSILKANLAITGFASRSHVYAARVERALTFLSGSYGFILMDPPYSFPTLDDTLEGIGGSSLIASSSVAAVEHSKRLRLKPGYGAFALMLSRRYGDTTVDFFRVGGI